MIADARVHDSRPRLFQGGLVSLQTRRSFTNYNVKGRILVCEIAKSMESEEFRKLVYGEVVLHWKWDASVCMSQM
jgi:hypothetical protein